ncbi:TetR/AcrR family transcriptional regulator [Bacteroidales bacterium MB20-C3-3]|nr:TetR/AcrR family transcriptional regulator [Bacteroidales bacterium MB20-C3-3]
MKPVKDSSTEEKILIAAEKLFYERGYAMTHTTDIARLAGCNQALVHYYFRSKERLFDLFFENKVRLFINVFLTEGNDESNFQAKIAKKIKAHFDILKANPRLPFLLFNEISTNQKRLEKIRENLGVIPSLLIQNLDKELDDLYKKGEIRQISAVDLMLSIISLNAVMFIADPIVRIMTNCNDEEFSSMLEKRREDNVKTILARLQPCPLPQG